MNTKTRVAMIGCGALGKILIEGLKTRLSDRFTLCGVWSKHIETHQELLDQAGVQGYRSFQALLQDAPELIIEIASTQAVREYGEMILSRGIHLVVTSAGAFADAALRDGLVRMAQSHGGKIYIASGAIGGFDLFRTLAFMGKVRGRIENFKSPESLQGAPYLTQMELPAKEGRIFSGSVSDAIAGFPKNVNVAVAAALAGEGLDSFLVEIDSCPGMTQNLHRITMANDTVEAVVSVGSRPDRENAKSSSLAAWSILAMLDAWDQPLQFF